MNGVGNKVVVAYRNDSNLGYGTARVGIIDSNNNFISFGTPVVFSNSTIDDISITYDSNNKKVIIAYSDVSNLGYGTVVVGDINKTTISFGLPIIFNKGKTTNISAVYDSINQKVIIVYSDYNDGICDGAAIVGTIKPNNNSISLGAPVIFSSGPFLDISAVYDSINSKIVIAYNKVNNAYCGITIVGTITGGSILFGAPVVFSNEGAEYISAIYDIINNKVIIAYADTSNSYRGTIIIGTINGESISFNAPVLFSNKCAEYINITYNPINQKVIIFYSTNNNSYRSMAVVGIISEESILFGDPVIFSNNISHDISAIYDPINQKVIMAYSDYNDEGDNSIAVVGDVSGTSISFGNKMVFNDISATNICYLS